jgi:hypothetical protein
LIALAISSGWTLAAEAENGRYRGTVHLQIIDSTGTDLGRADVQSFVKTIFKGKHDRNLASKFRNNTISGVPFGVYELRTYTKGFYTAKREVRVYQSDVWVVVQLQIGDIEAGDLGPTTTAITGQVMNLQTQGPVWVRAAGLFSGVIVDGKTEANGSFQISGLPVGDYILITRQENRVLDMRRVSAGKDSVVIDLGMREE